MKSSESWSSLSAFSIISRPTISSASARLSTPVRCTMAFEEPRGESFSIKNGTGSPSNSMNTGSGASSGKQNCVSLEFYCFTMVLIREEMSGFEYFKPISPHCWLR